MINTQEAILERRIEDILRLMEIKKERERQDVVEERLTRGRSLLNALIEDKKIDLNEKFLWSVVQNYWKSGLEPRMVFALSVIKIAVERDRPQMAPILEFMHLVPRAVRRVKQPVFADFFTRVYGMIIKTFSTGVIQVLEQHTHVFIADISENYARLGDEKYLIYSLLCQIIKSKHYLVLKEIKTYGSIVIFRNILKERSVEQKVSLVFAHDLILEISKLDKDEQKNCFSEVINELLKEAQESRAQSPENYFCAFYSLFKFFFHNLSRSFFTPDDCGVVFEKLLLIGEDSCAKRNFRICRAFFEMTPVMINYNSTLYYKLFLKKLFTTLLKLVDEVREAEFLEALCLCLRKVLILYTSEAVMQFCEQLFLKLTKAFEGWPERRDDRFAYYELFKCLKSVVKRLKNVQVGNEAKVNGLMDKLLIYGFNNVTLQILQLFHKSTDSAFNSLIETKLKYTIAIILKKNIRAFEDEPMDREDYPKSLILKKMADQNNLSQLLVESDNSRLAESVFDFEDDEQKQLDTTIHKLLESPSRRRPAMQSLKIPGSDFFTINRRLYLEDFARKLETHYKDEKKSSRNAVSESQISIALEALAKFDFGEKTNEKRTDFIKDTVLAYLESPSAELRKRAARIVFHLSSDQNPPFRASLSLANKIIQGIINKMMAIAIGDPDNSVREETLTALNTKNSRQFIPYLVSEDNLKKLIILVYDMNYKIQKQSILLLEKLVPSYPELLSRFDQIIFRTISFLGTTAKNFGEEDKNHVKILQIIAKNSQFLIDGRLPVIVNLLVDILGSCLIKPSIEPQDNFKQEMIIAIFKCLAQLFDFQPVLSREYFQKCVDIFLTNLKRFDENILVYLFRCIIVLTKNSSYQLILVIKYNIHQFVFEILDRNVSTKLRCELLKLIGTIGAIDPLLFRKISLMRAKNKVNFHMSNYELLACLEKLRKKPFNFERFLSHEQNPKAEALQKTFENFKNNVRLIQKNTKGQASALLSVPKSKIFKNVIMDLKQKFVAMKVANPDLPAIEMTTAHKIQNQDALFKFVTGHTFNVLFGVVEAPRDEELTRYALESIQQIILNLGKHILEFKDIVFHRLVSFFYKTAVVKLKILTLQNVKYFIKAAGIEISKENEFISVLIKLLIRFFPNEDYQPELFSVCRLLIDYKMSLRHRFKDIITTLLSMLSANPLIPSCHSIFEIILHLDNQEYLYLITPALSKLFTYFNQKQTFPKKQQEEIVRYIFSYFDKIKSTKHFDHFSGNIIRAVIAFLKDFPEYQELIRRFLIEVIRTLRERCFNYLPLIHPYLKDTPAYIQILKDLNEKGYIEESPVMQSNSIDEHNHYPMVNDSESNLQAHSLREFNYEAVRNVFVITNASKSHNWDDWFNRLCIELISNSPSTVLIACKTLIFYQEIMKQLFRPAFVVFWSQLRDQQRAQILRGFDTIISNPLRIPLKVRKEIIELIEFMSHENKYGLVLDITKLAEFSLKCHSISKAIFFKEMEFQNNPENAIETLLALYAEAGYKYAAEGLLEYAQNTLKLAVKSEWLESLGQWDKIYNENKRENNDETSKLQILCNLALSNWEWVLDKVRDAIRKNKDTGELAADKALSTYGAKAAFHLGRWEALENFADNVQTDKDFYTALVNVNKGAFDEARIALGESLKIVEKESLPNYNTSYDKILKLQIIAELEEIVNFKKRFTSLERKRALSLHCSN